MRTSAERLRNSAEVDSLLQFWSVTMLLKLGKPMRVPTSAKMQVVELDAAGTRLSATAMAHRPPAETGYWVKPMFAGTCALCLLFCWGVRESKVDR